MPTVAMGTAVEHPVQDVICNFDIRALVHSALNIRVPGCQKLQMTA